MGFPVPFPHATIREALKYRTSGGDNLFCPRIVVYACPPWTVPGGIAMGFPVPFPQSAIVLAHKQRDRNPRKPGSNLCSMRIRVYACPPWAHLPGGIALRTPVPLPHAAIREALINLAPEGDNVLCPRIVVYAYPPWAHLPGGVTMRTPIPLPD
jgi:hypothetical protein